MSNRLRAIGLLIGAAAVYAISWRCWQIGGEWSAEYGAFWATVAVVVAVWTFLRKPRPKKS